MQQMEEDMHSCCAARHTVRTQDEKKAMLHRLSRIEGQVRGLRRMVEEETYCPDILRQVAAADAALRAFGQKLLEGHIRRCVAEDIRQGQDETLDELIRTLEQLMR